MQFKIATILLASLAVSAYASPEPCTTGAHADGKHVSHHHNATVHHHVSNHTLPHIPKNGTMINGTLTTPRGAVAGKKVPAKHSHGSAHKHVHAHAHGHKHGHVHKPCTKKHKAVTTTKSKTCTKSAAATHKPTSTCTKKSSGSTKAPHAPQDNPKKAASSHEAAATKAATTLAAVSTTAKATSSAPALVHKKPTATASASKASTTAKVTSSSAAPAKASSTAVVNGGKGGISGSRLKTIESLYAFAGFVYDVSTCPSASTINSDMKAMKAKGARAFITFEACDNKGFWDDIIKAAQTNDLLIMPLVWTMLENSGDSIQGTVQPRIDTITKAVIANPSHVLAVAMGDEPVYDQDFGDNSVLVQKIKTMQAAFKKAGQDIPVSVSDMAYGWKQGGDISSVADAVDFFMINNFPYFAVNAAGGGDSSAWSNFMSDMTYFKGIAKGKPLFVTQTGWPSNKNEFNPNSGAVQATVNGGEEPFAKLLDSHCSDYFKKNKIGWMWRDWNDNISGWGLLDGNGQPKFSWNMKTSC